MTEANPPETARLPASMRWLARIAMWLCWLAIAAAVAFEILDLFDAIPDSWVVRDSSSDPALISSQIIITEPAGAEAALRHDLLYRLAGLIPFGLFVWALASAIQSFAGIGRGDYFGRRTVLGVRNLALAVLLHMTVAPIVLIGAKAAYLSRFEHGTFSISFGLNEPILLTLIFTAFVALISAVMAHGAKLAEENRQFV